MVIEANYYLNGTEIHHQFYSKPDLPLFWPPAANTSTKNRYKPLKISLGIAGAMEIGCTLLDSGVFLH